MFDVAILVSVFQAPARVFEVALINVLFVWAKCVSRKHVEFFCIIITEKNAILRLPRGSDLASMYVAPKLNSTKYSHTCVWPLHWHTCVFEVESWRCLWPRVDLSRLWSGSRLFFSHSTTLARPLQCMVRTIVCVIVSHVVEKLVQWRSDFQSG